MLPFLGLWTETGDGGAEGKIHAASAAGYDTNKKSNVRKGTLLCFGASCLTRTGDTLINSQVL